MAMIRAIDYAEGDSYQVPEELGVKWYCYAAWNVVGGLESEPTYSRLIRVEFYENSSPHPQLRPVDGNHGANLHGGRYQDAGM